MEMNVKLPEKYKLLCNYKNHVLAEKEFKIGDTVYNEYVTWKKDGTGVTLGHYFDNLKSAESDFAVRCDMLNTDKYLSRNELALAYRALDVYRYSDVAQYSPIDIEKDADALSRKIGRIDGVKHSKYSEISILVVEPNIEPYVDATYDDWGKLHRDVGQYTQDIPVNQYDDTVIIKKDLSKDIVLPENRTFNDNQLYGKFIIVNATDNDRYYSLTKVEIDTYKKQFSINKTKNAIDKSIDNIKFSKPTNKDNNKER